MRPLPSFVHRLIGWQVLAMGLLWVILIVGLLFVMTRYENGDLDQRMAYFATILAETAAGSRERPEELPARLRAVDRVFVDGVIKRLENARDYVPAYQILDSNGQPIYRTGAGPASAWPVPAGFADDDYQGTHYRTVRVRSVDQQLSVIVAESDATRWASIEPMLRIIGVSQIVIFVGCIAVLWWAAKRGFGPIRQMAAALAAKECGDVEPVLDRLGYRETEPLVRAFNDLLAREAQRMDAERGFLADAAHELRTPLAALAARAQQLVAAQDEAIRRSTAAELEKGILRISHLLSQLLTVARLDAFRAAVVLETVDVAELLRQTLAAFVPAARRKGITLSLDAPDVALVLATRPGLSSIIENIVDNAIRYTPDGGQVSVSLDQQRTAVELRVTDNGPGIQPALREAVFERFYRLPGTVAEGSGLGLAIVRRLAEAFRATVRLGPGPEGRGLTVALVFLVHNAGPQPKRADPLAS
jgi:signal transduction histidine kinase